MSSTDDAMSYGDNSSSSILHSHSDPSDSFKNQIFFPRVDDELVGSSLSSLGPRALVNVFKGAKREIKSMHVVREKTEVIIIICGLQLWCTYRQYI
jgi:hypothetical protein